MEIANGQPGGAQGGSAEVNAAGLDEFMRLREELCRATGLLSEYKTRAEAAEEAELQAREREKRTRVRFEQGPKHRKESTAAHRDAVDLDGDTPMATRFRRLLNETYSPIQR